VVPTTGSADRVKPSLYLDVDGVLLPLGKGAWESDRIRVGPFYVHLPRDLHRLVPELHAVFEIVWATSWCEEANVEVGPLLGLPPLPALEVTAHWRKLELVRAHAGEGTPFAWIDDRLEPEAVEWAGRREGPSLLIRPESARGLTPEHVAELLAFAAELAAG
jgi:HAD domain in Swiss Army Knife RNA repair proteins